MLRADLWPVEDSAGDRLRIGTAMGALRTVDSRLALAYRGTVGNT